MPATTKGCNYTVLQQLTKYLRPPPFCNSKLSICPSPGPSSSSWRIFLTAKFSGHLKLTCILYTKARLENEEYTKKERERIEGESELNRDMKLKKRQYIVNANNVFFSLMFFCTHSFQIFLLRKILLSLHFIAALGGTLEPADVFFLLHNYYARIANFLHMSLFLYLHYNVILAS